MFVVLNLICEPRNANTQRKNTFTSFRAITKTDIFYWCNLWQFKNKPRFAHTSEIYLQLRAAFHHSFFLIYRIPRACVIKFAVKSSIFVSTETKYVSQIHLDVSQIYCGSCHRRAFQAFAIPLLFDGKWRIACVVSRLQVKLSRAKVQSSGTNFVASQAKLSAIPWSFFTMKHFVLFSLHFCWLKSHNN